MGAVYPNQVFYQVGYQLSSTMTCGECFLCGVGVATHFDVSIPSLQVEVKPQKQKKSRKMADFFEQEAELTSEDEWVGSGDEDEAGLDRMEREAGDDDKFHEGQLQRELGQIHM